MSADLRSPTSVRTDERPRFLSESDCKAVANMVSRAARPGSFTAVSIRSSWTGNIRWVRNQVISSGEMLDNSVSIACSLNGAGSRVVIVNDADSHAIVAAVRRAERLSDISREQPQSDLLKRRPMEPCLAPSLFDQATYDLDADHRAQAARDLASSAVDAGMLSAGYVQVSGHSQAVIDTDGRSRFFEFTHAQYSVTVRDPRGTGSGWAGVDHTAWSRIDAAALSKRALDKCLESRNPAALEPGRYTAILEPQAVGDLVSTMIPLLDRERNEGMPPGPFTDVAASMNTLVRTLLGKKIFDERITITSDPMDPDGGFPPWISPLGIDGRSEPFELGVFSPVTWVEQGVLKNLAYMREYAIQRLGRPTGLPVLGAFRMTGGSTSVDEMIATTQRGILVTRFDRLQVLDERSVLSRGFTRDGLWLIENGKISKPIKNFLVTESPLFALNNLEQLGVPVRTFRPLYWGNPTPVIVPPIKVRDFSFTSLSDAV